MRLRGGRTRAGAGHAPARGGRKPRFALGQPRYDRPMLSLLYLVVRALVRLLVSAGRAGRVDGSQDLEILVLRPPLRGLPRTSGPRKLRAIDRVLLAAAVGSSRVTAGSPFSSPRRPSSVGIASS